MEPASLLRKTLENHVALSDAEFQYMFERSHHKKYKKGQFLIHEGSILRKTHFILKGAVIVYYIDKEGSEHLIQFGIEGWWISDIKSYIGKGEAIYNVQALEDAEVLEFDADTMNLIYEKVPAVMKYFLIVTQIAFCAFQERIMLKNSSSAEERYTHLTEKYPWLESRFPQKWIASWLGITPEFLSKLKKGMRNVL